MSIEPSASDRTEVGPVQAVAVGPDKTVAPSHEIECTIERVDTDEHNGQLLRLAIEQSEPRSAHKHLRRGESLKEAGNLRLSGLGENDVVARVHLPHGS